jgi:PiT family inorganic phosphate transporter
MSDMASAIERPKLDHPIDPRAIWGFLAILAAGLLFVAYSIYVDVDATHTPVTTFLPFILLGWHSSSRLASSS